MDQDERAGRRRRVLIGAGAGVALLAVGGSAWALSGGSEHPPAAGPPVPAASAPPSALSATTAAPSPPTPSPSVSPTGAASPRVTPSRAPKAATTRRATSTPPWRISPGTDDPHNDGGTTTHATGCATNPAGEIMTCDPVKTGIPLPRTP
ncbi:hypothetical protein [Kitasatospora sp. DSM 101779]|uniref:hypothetical protein n=1 Tax=Kitasatospora sp. DSM 101779 TaxID=2853165 RepID=UPI0021DA4471|nr:hypothetical protein [Kitasatospora sp. DSM 101779]MCU7825371.1 hypothetical protein [Kitasatospora sp. DSM 101779]